MEEKRKSPVMPRGGMRIKEPGRGPWCQRKKGKWRRKEASCYASGGMRIKKPGRGPWYQKKNKQTKTKERMEEERSLLLCLGGHENKGIRSRTVEFKRRKEVADFCYATGWREERVT